MVFKVILILRIFCQLTILLNQVLAKVKLFGKITLNYVKVCLTYMKKKTSRALAFLNLFVYFTRSRHEYMT